MTAIAKIETSTKMTSLEISEITGKAHNDVMKAIRAMEPAWEREITKKYPGREGKFSLAEYKDKQGKPRPMYELNEKECLYIATKFNDDARAKLVIRWEELEKKNSMPLVPQSFSQALLLAAQQQEQIEKQQLQLTAAHAEIADLNVTIQGMGQKVSYFDKILKSPSTTKTKVIAQDYGMSAIAFNNLLHQKGIQYKQGEDWFLYAKYQGFGYVKNVPFEYTRANGSLGVKNNMQWTQKGLKMIYDELKADGILPLIECNE